IDQFDRGSPELPTVKEIGPVRITGIISRRLTCDVYKGLQNNPRRDVAVKVLNTARSDERITKSFRREIRTLAKLRHPGIAEVYFAGECLSGQQRALYFVMEYVDGPTITSYSDQEKLSTRQRVELLIKVCEAILHAHQRGVIHRDLKPTNILTTTDGHPKVLDFGIAKSVEPTGTAHSYTGVGTPAYMSPEQFDGDQEQNIHTDIYSLGVILFELMCGRLPYAKSVQTIGLAANAICNDDPLDLRVICPQCSQDLAAITRKCLQKLPQDRYQSVQELTQDLRSFLAGDRVFARSLSPRESLIKFANRHRIASSLGALTFLAVAISALTSFWFWRREVGVVTTLSETVAVSPDGETLAIGGANSEITLCDAITGEFQASLQGHSDAVTDLEFTFDGLSLLSVSLDGTLRRWSPRRAGTR
ncbi:MAG: protein kinase, partial [Planctomycetales bacterium]|nr:protein kinase [Planctomycetales bacterium]